MNFVIHAYILCTVFQNNYKKWKKKIGCSYRGQTVKIPSINTLKIFAGLWVLLLLFFLLIARFVDICVHYNNTLVQSWQLIKDDEYKKKILNKT